MVHQQEPDQVNTKPDLLTRFLRLSLCVIGGDVGGEIGIVLSRLVGMRYEPLGLALCIAMGVVMGAWCGVTVGQGLGLLFAFMRSAGIPDNVDLTKLTNIGGQEPGASRIDGITAGIAIDSVAEQRR